MMVRSPAPSFTLQTDSLSEPGTFSRVRTSATTTPSNSPPTLCIPSTSRPSMVRRAASSSGDQSKSTYFLSQFSVTFIEISSYLGRESREAKGISPGQSISGLSRVEYYGAVGVQKTKGLGVFVMKAHEWQ